MMYECVRCKTVLAAGSTECPQCGMKFDRPIPDDATLSEAPLPQEEVIVAPPIIDDAPLSSPEQAERLAPNAYPAANPYPAPAQASYSPPMPVYVTPPASSGLSPTNKVLLIAVPLCVILGIVIFFVVQSLNQGNNNAVPPPAAITTPITAPTPVATTGTLSPLETAPGNGGTSPSNATDPTQFLVGRWQSNQTFYVFGGDGSGSRGALSDAKKNETFTWALINNELDVHGSKDEKLAFSAGPDHNTMFLRQANGHYEQYKRQATG